MFLLSAPAMMCTVRPGRRLFRAGHMALPMALARWFARYAARNLRPRRRRRRRSSSNALFGMLPRNNWKIMHFQEEPRSQHTQLLRCSFCRRFMTRLLICTRQNSGRRRVVGSHFGCSRRNCKCVRRSVHFSSRLWRSGTHVSCDYEYGSSNSAAAITLNTTFLL